MLIFLPLSCGKRGWLRWLILASILILVGIFCLFVTGLYDVRRPVNGHWSTSAEESGNLRDAGFEGMLEQARIRDRSQVVLKVFFGWSQNVWIAVQNSPGAEPQVQIAEYDFRSGRHEFRIIALSRSEVNEFLAKFDRVALGFRIVEVGYDGREISFERSLSDRIVSYEGNASFSRQDASMARIVDQLIANHGGYKFIRPSRSGQGF